MPESPPAKGQPHIAFTARRHRQIRAGMNITPGRWQSRFCGGKTGRRIGAGEHFSRGRLEGIKTRRIDRVGDHADSRRQPRTFRPGFSPVRRDVRHAISRRPHDNFAVTRNRHRAAFLFRCRITFQQLPRCSAIRRNRGVNHVRRTVADAHDDLRLTRREHDAPRAGEARPGKGAVRR